MANEIKTIDLKDCVFIFRDGTPSTPNELEIKLDEGNMTWTETRNIIPVKDRGELDYIKEGDEENCKVNIQCRFDALKSSSGDFVTPHEFLKKEGAASAYLTTDGDCAADAIDIIVKVKSKCSTVQHQIITFSSFTYNELGGDFRAGTLSVQGMLNAVGPTSVRTTVAPY